MRSATAVSLGFGFDFKTWAVGFWWEKTRERLPGHAVTICVLCLGLRVCVQEVMVP